MSDEPTDEVAAEPEPEPAPTMYGVPMTDGPGQTVLHPSVETYVETVQGMKQDGYVSVIDLCGVDYLSHQGRRLPAGITGERFELVVNLLAHNPPRRARLRVQISADEPTVPTLFDEFPGVENMEREAFDMFGIVFSDHPDPTRILMPHDWDGHPLRKDFGIGSVPVQFKA